MALDIELLHDSPHLLTLLVGVENILDELDVYVFENWIDGEIVDGPRVRRFWIDITLQYPYRKMPDPRAALRLLKHGVRVDFRKAKIDGKSLEESASNDQETSEEKTSSDNKVWLITVSVPRRLMADLSNEEFDFYDDEVDMEDAEEAKDTGIDDESAYHADEQQDQMMGGDPNTIPDDQQNDGGR